MDQQQMRRRDRWRLRQQVHAKSGSATKFSPVEQHLSRWIQAGAEAPRATTDTVLPYLAGYVDAASSVGRKWGKVAGLVLGVAIGLVAFLIDWVVT